MTADGKRLHWLRIVVAVIVAESLPILLLILVVVVYGFTRQPDSLSPEQFAPLAGNWVGPLGGFLATLLCAHHVARSAPGRRMAHGVVIGVGTALVDIGLALLLEGIGGLLLLSNAGRVVAGLFGGWFAARRATTSATVE